MRERVTFPPPGPADGPVPLTGVRAARSSIEPRLEDHPGMTRAPWRAVAPDGISFLPADRCAGHPAARGRDEVAFLWAVGRIDRTRGRHAASELDLLHAAFEAAGGRSEAWSALALDYAAHVFRSAPDSRARLDGRAIGAFFAGRSAEAA